MLRKKTETKFHERKIFCMTRRKKKISRENTFFSLSLFCWFGGHYTIYFRCDAIHFFVSRGKHSHKDDFLHIFSAGFFSGYYYVLQFSTETFLFNIFMPYLYLIFQFTNFFRFFFHFFSAMEYEKKLISIVFCPFFCRCIYIFSY